MRRSSNVFIVNKNTYGVTPYTMLKLLRKKNNIPSLFFAEFLFSIFPWALPALAAESGIKVGGTGLKESAEEAGIKTTGTLPGIIGNIIGGILGILGTVFLLLIVIAGIRWMTAGGNEEQVISSKRTIVASFLGLVVIFLSYAFARFVASIFASA